MVHDLLEAAALFSFDARWLRPSLRSITIMCMCTSTVVSAQPHRRSDQHGRGRRAGLDEQVCTDDQPQHCKTGRTAGPFKPQQSKITWSSVLRGNAGGESNFHASVNSL